MSNLEAEYFISFHLISMSFFLEIIINFLISVKLSVKPQEYGSLHRCFNL